MVKIRTEVGSLLLENRHCKVIWRKNRKGEYEESYYYKTPSLSSALGKVRYHLQFFKKGGSDIKSIKMKSYEVLEDSKDIGIIKFHNYVQGLGYFSLTYSLQRDSSKIKVNLLLKFSFDDSLEIGLRALCIESAISVQRIRYLHGVYSGWTHGKRTLLLYQRYNDDYPQRQFSLIPHHEERGRKQGMALAYPPGYFNGTIRCLHGQETVGSICLHFLEKDIWDPKIFLELEQEEPPTQKIDMGRYSYGTHIKLWKKFITRKELWTNVGRGMGFFHRGFWNVLNKPKISGVLWYKNGKHMTEDSELIELAWGGSHNTLLSYTLYVMEEEWAKERADIIVRSLFEFRNGGFQVKGGKLKGAWYNAYWLKQNRFCDRYGGDQVFAPDQGIINYFLSKIYLEGYNQDRRIVESIRKNCEEFLLRIRTDTGEIKYALKGKGEYGHSREGFPYNTCFASGDALGALSFICLYNLTKEAEYLDEAKKLIDHLIGEHLEQNEWRFLEYDSTGIDSIAPSWILISLCEFLKCRDDKKVRKMAELTFAVLRSFQQTNDFQLGKFATNEKGYGGEMANKWGFLLGSNPKSLQGTHCSHLRYDPQLALYVYYQLSKDIRAYTSLINHLNFLTYHQFTNTELPIGYGALSECTHFLEGRVQDTVQVLHSNPLLMLLLEKGLYLKGTNTNVIELKMGGEQLCFTLESNDKKWTWFSIGGKGKESVKVFQGKKLIHCGDGEKVNALFQGKASFEVK